MAREPVVIPEKIYFKIGEVCDLVDVQAHVLRYWETEFPQLAPQKNRSGQRSYRRKDVETALRIKELLYEEMYTIAGARKKLHHEQRENGKHKNGESAAPMPADSEQSLFDSEIESNSERSRPEVGRARPAGSFPDAREPSRSRDAGGAGRPDPVRNVSRRHCRGS